MVIHNNLASVVRSIGRNNATSTKKIQVGRVYGIITTENTPTKTMFENVGGFSGIGTVFYLDYDQAKDIIGD